MNIRHLLLGTTLLGLAAAAPNAAAEYYGENPVVAAASVHYDVGDFAAALPGMRQGADSGDFEAQYFLAMMYKDGNGVAASPAMAKHYFEKAGAQEHEDALFQLGYMYEHGTGVPADDAKAFQYYQEAAWGGSSNGAFHAGYMIMNGRGTEFDGYAADDLFTRAASADMTEAQMTLAYLNQEKMIPDATKDSAHYWYSRAMENGHPLAEEKIKALASMSSIPEAFALLNAGKDEQAALAFQALCKGGNNAACYELGIMLLQGSGDEVEAMPSRAVEPLYKACQAKVEQGCHAHAVATLNTGADAYISDIRQAAATFKDRCDQAKPDYNSCYSYAYMRYYTRFRISSYDEAKSASSKACFQGSVKSACGMALEMINNDLPKTRAPAKKSGFLGQALGAAFGSMAAMGAASGGGYNGSSYNYSPNNYRDPYAGQSQRDFNQFVKKVGSYGSAYSVSCRPGNPYC